MIIFSFAYINSKNNNKEGFTKKFREKMRGFYRPVIRKSRVSIENFKNETINRFKNTIDSLI
jgi:hypothetical protein